MTQFEKKGALSIPKNSGRRGRYKTSVVGSRKLCSGRPLLGRADVRSLQNQIESLPGKFSASRWI